MQKNAPILITGAGGFIGKTWWPPCASRATGTCCCSKKPTRPTPCAGMRGRRRLCITWRASTAPGPWRILRRQRRPYRHPAQLSGRGPKPRPGAGDQQHPGRTQQRLRPQQGPGRGSGVYARPGAGAPVYVFRLPGVFGKWCRPNYNSVVATFAIMPPTACRSPCATQIMSCPWCTSTMWSAA